MTGRLIVSGRNSDSVDRRNLLAEEGAKSAADRVTTPIGAAGGNLGKQSRRGCEGILTVDVRDAGHRTYCTTAQRVVVRIVPANAGSAFGVGDTVFISEI